MTNKKSEGHISSGTALTTVGAPRLGRQWSYNQLSSALISAFDKSPSGETLPLTLHNAALSEDTRAVERRISDLQIPPSPASIPTQTGGRPLEERLFDATASVKILTSQIAMHLEREWRDKLFRQLDSLHDVQEWDEDDVPIRQASFATFLKAIIQIKPKRRPGLGLSHSGNLIAAWTEKTERLTIEFLPNERVRWVVGRSREDGPEHIAGDTRVSRLVEALAPYHPALWFA